MKLRYHYARQRRQLAYLSKRLTRLQANGQRISADNLAKLKSLASRLLPRIGGTQVRRVLGTGIFLLAGATVAQAQVFEAPVTNPFGIDADIGVSNNYNNPVFADLDGDGDLDLITTLYEYVGEDDPVLSSLFYQENTGSATLPQFAARQTDPFGFQPTLDIRVISVVDLDSDGDLDLLGFGSDDRTGVFGDEATVYYENMGTAVAPTFAAGILDTFSLEVPNTDFNSLQPSFGDIDGDGDLDIIGPNLDGSTDGGVNPSGTFYFENTTVRDSVSFAEPVGDPFGLDLDVFERYSDLVDIDQDGDLDLIGTRMLETEINEDSTTYTNQIIFLENIGTATMPAFTDEVVNAFGIAQSDGDGVNSRPVVADLDGDGKPDLLVFTGSGGLYYKNRTVVSTRDRAVDLNLQVYPNPATSTVNIQTDHALTSIQVLDAFGRNVSVQTDNLHQVDMSAFTPGVYVLKFSLEGGTYGTRKVFKR